MGTVWILINYTWWWIWSRVRNYQGTSLERSLRNRADLAGTSTNGNEIKELLASRSVGLSRILFVSAAFSHVPYPKCPISYWMCSWGYSDGIKRSVWTVTFSLPLCRKLSSRGDLCPRNNNGVRAAFDVVFLPLAVRLKCIFKLLWMSQSNQMHVFKNQSDGLMSHGRLSHINQIQCFIVNLWYAFFFF